MSFVSSKTLHRISCFTQSESRVLNTRCWEICSSLSHSSPVYQTSTLAAMAHYPAAATVASSLFCGLANYTLTPATLHFFPEHSSIRYQRQGLVRPLSKVRFSACHLNSLCLTDPISLSLQHLQYSLLSPVLYKHLPVISPRVETLQRQRWGFFTVISLAPGRLLALLTVSVYQRTE